MNVEKRHIIELNGKRYDAITGKMISPTPVAAAKAKTPQAKSASVDGFAKTASQIGNPTPSHRVEKAKTLMRATVSKPAPTPTTAPKTETRAHASSVALSTHKLTHARTVPKSALVRRFSDMMPTAKLSLQQTTKKPQAISRVHATATATATTVANNSLASGLSSANSHEQPGPRRAKLHARVANRLRISPKILSGGSLVLAGLLIGGFFAYQNIPNLAMRLASARAGVHGTLPGYQPAGFSLHGGISYKPGQITIGYKANGDRRNFTITQTPSAWNSETLVENYTALKEGSPYQTIPTKGKTIYIFNGSNATWVDGGIWYRVEGDSELNSDQLLNIANSM